MSTTSRAALTSWQTLKTPTNSTPLCGNTAAGPGFLRAAAKARACMSATTQAKAGRKEPIKTVCPKANWAASDWPFPKATPMWCMQSWKPRKMPSIKVLMAAKNGKKWPKRVRATARFITLKSMWTLKMSNGCIRFTPSFRAAKTAASPFPPGPAGPSTPTTTLSGSVPTTRITSSTATTADSTSPAMAVRPGGMPKTFRWVSFTTSKPTTNGPTTCMAACRTTAPGSALQQSGSRAVSATRTGRRCISVTALKPCRKPMTHGTFMRSRKAANWAW